MSYIMWIPPSIAGTTFIKTETTEGEEKAGVSCTIEWDPNGEWVTWDEFVTEKRPENVSEKDLCSWWDMLRNARPISNKIKGLIQDTLDLKLAWNFVWVWFTGGFWFPAFVTFDEKGERDLMAQIAWPPKEWGYIVIVSGKSRSTYDSIMDDEEIPEIGMEFWHLLEDNCVNHDYLIEEMNKRNEALERGEKYPVE
jgi:hypothetical protein